MRRQTTALDPNAALTRVLTTGAPSERPIEVPGLFFVGLPWLHNPKSGLIYGVSEDAAYITEMIVSDQYRSAT